MTDRLTVRRQPQHDIGGAWAFRIDDGELATDVHVSTLLARTARTILNPLQWAENEAREIGRRLIEQEREQKISKQRRVTGEAAYRQARLDSKQLRAWWVANEYAERTKAASHARGEA